MKLAPPKIMGLSGKPFADNDKVDVLLQRWDFRPMVEGGVSEALAVARTAPDAPATLAP